MIYFFHHYELPIIIQQARVQQMLVIRSRQQQQQRNGINQNDDTNQAGNGDGVNGGGGGGAGGPNTINNPRIINNNTINNNNNNIRFWRNPAFYSTVWFFFEQFVILFATMSNPILHIIEDMILRMAGFNNFGLFGGPLFNHRWGHRNLNRLPINFMAGEDGDEELMNLLNDNEQQPGNEFRPMANWSVIYTPEGEMEMDLDVDESEPDGQNDANHSDGNQVNVATMPSEHSPLIESIPSASISQSTGDLGPSTADQLSDSEISKEFEMVTNNIESFTTIDGDDDVDSDYGVYKAEKISDAIQPEQQANYNNIIPNNDNSYIHSIPNPTTTHQLNSIPNCSNPINVVQPVPTELHRIKSETPAAAAAAAAIERSLTMTTASLRDCFEGCTSIEHERNSIDDKGHKSCVNSIVNCNVQESVTGSNCSNTLNNEPGNLGASVSAMATTPKIVATKQFDCDDK